MGNVAVMLKSMGNEVCGSDTGVYEPMKGVLQRAGIEICEGWSVERLKSIAPDLVVVGNVISRMNPEIEWLLQSRAFAFTSLAGLIGEKIISSRPSLVVSGTHGKTTTTTLCAYLLSKIDSKTGWMIGGVPQNLSSGSNYGSKDSPFAIEGDEYDTAFFDKRSKFIHYRPRVLLINNIEFDHADIFRDLTDVKRTFTHVRRIVSGNGLIVENGDDENIASLEDTPWVPRLKVGVGKDCGLRISNFNELEFGSEFELLCGAKSVKIKWNMQGIFNARNAAMAIAGCAAILNIKNPLDLPNIDSLKDFGGVKRRQELILKSEKVCAIEDFGHHPTAILQTLKSVAARFKDRKIYACFEPRSNTAKTNIFESEFAASLALADRVYIGFCNSKKVAEGKRMDTSHLAKLGGQKFAAFDANESLLQKLCEDVKAEPQKLVCVFFSNGSFDGIHKKFAEIFANK